MRLVAVLRYESNQDVAQPSPKVRYDEQRIAPTFLLIAVQDPKKPGVMALSRVRDEADAIEKLLRPIVGKLTVLKDSNATWDNIRAELANEDYDIIHFCGHAHFDESSTDLGNSQLLTYKSDITSTEITEYFIQAKPILCFINGCESVLGSDSANRLCLYGLGKAFLSTGAYLLGTRSRVGDKGAAEFAIVFYTKLLKERLSLGESVMWARRACKQKSSGTFGWASYILYGDPRFFFPRPATSVPGRRSVNGPEPLRG
jgi:CHAT domain-containing protein